ncbi:MAG: sigma-54-dependent Fis family transcriptional regulator [Verrucomicrobiae bacterium]|nr:sigma-54-dependent Fis family transcriptional regulator [Verrucomicrobiae bacterium]
MSEIESEQPRPAVPRVLVIDDEAVVGMSCRRALAPGGSQVDIFQDPRLGAEAALAGDYDLILLDVVMPQADGLEILRRIRAAGIRSEVVIITGHATVEMAVEAMKSGATDYLCKPFSPDELRLVVGKVAERSALISENNALRRELETHRGLEGIIGESRAMQRMFTVLRRIAPTPATVLITGESGTGKELVARAIHRLSPRRDQAFLACDCGTLSPSLLESELFGHVRGAFTGASANRTGLLEAASGGTLFLDEIANVSLDTQAKLLRVLETRRVRRVGATEEADIDIRLVAATNRDLADLVAKGQFREDLFYRLNVLPVVLPPLRDRHGDVPLLALAFLEHLRKSHTEIRAHGFTPEAIRLLDSHPWPGNVRELKNIVERMAVLGSGELLDAGDVPPELLGVRIAPVVGALPHDWQEFRVLKRRLRDEAIHDLERRYLVETLDRAGGNVSRAAEMVGIQRTQLHALLQKHALRGSGEDATTRS